MQRKYVTLLLLLGVLSPILVACGSTNVTEETIVEARVEAKYVDEGEWKTETVETRKAQNTYNWKNTTRKEKEVYDDTDYQVTVRYGQMMTTFDRKDFFDEVEVGDTVKVIYTKTTDEEGNLVEDHLALPKQQ